MIAGPTVLVNLVKLTRLEKKVLDALTRETCDSLSVLVGSEMVKCYDIKEGHSTAGVAVLVYGETALSHYQDETLRPAVRSSMSRTLNALNKRGLVHKCKPQYSRRWSPSEREGDVGFMEKRLTRLSCHNKEVSIPMFISLPRNTRVWWVVSKQGRGLIEDETGVTQSRNRCAGCLFAPDESGKCQRPEADYEGMILGSPSKAGGCDVFLDRDVWRYEDDPDFVWCYYRNTVTGFSTEVLWEALERQGKDEVV